MTFPSGRLLRNISITVRPVVRNGWYSDTSMTRSPPAGRLSPQPKQIFEPLKNNELFCCPANPFLDAWFWLTDRCAYQAISKGTCNYLLFIDIDTFREKTRVSRTYPNLESAMERYQQLEFRSTRNPK